MAARRRRQIPPSSKTYGFPIFSVAWVPLHRISAAASSHDDADDNQEATAGGPGADDRRLAVLSGGGGGGQSGVPNVLLIAEFDFVSRSLAAEPVFRMGTDSDVPYRMAVHPGGEGLVCAFPKGCRWFTWDHPDNKLTLRSSEEQLTALEDVGEQSALAFNADGSIFATGGEDGHLRVFKWPTMDIILDQSEAHSTVKDLNFSSDDKFLVSTGNSGPCRVWDLTSSTSTASLSREDGELFGLCRFSPTVADNQILYVTAMHGDYGKILTWSSLSWTRTGSKRIVRDAISAFNVSKDGKHLAVGTGEGNIIVVRASDMQVQTTVKEAHLGPVTALAFSEDSRALISTSFDSYAHVTVLESRRERGSNIWLVILVLFLAVLVFYMKSKRVF